MENTPRLYSELLILVGQHSTWRDIRHLYTLLWMVVGPKQEHLWKMKHK